MSDKHPYRWPTIFVFGLLLFFSLGNQIIYRYAVPPGGDTINHNPYAVAIMAGHILDVRHYHILWHTIVALVAITTHVQSITVMAWLGPILLFTSGVSVFILTRRYFGPIAGLAAVILIGFFSNQPLQTLYDGGFPNVMAAGTILPLVIIATDALFTSQKRARSVFIFFLSLIVLVYSHHLTTLYTLPILGLFFACQLWLTLRRRGVNRFLIMLIGAIVVILFLVASSFFLRHSVDSIANLANTFVSIDIIPPFIHLKGTLDNPNAIWPLSSYPSGIGEALVFLGSAGFFIAVYRAIKDAYKPEARISLLLIIWTVILLAASQTPALGFPVRLARDLAIPLAVLSGIFVGTILDYITKHRLPKLFVYIFVGLCILLSFSTSLSRYNRLISPNPLVYHLPVDSQAANYINSHLKLTDKIYTYGGGIYLPEFVPLHPITHIFDPEKLRSLAEATDLPRTLAGADYLYVEWRRDIEPNWINNEGIANRFATSPYLILGPTFEQPEKKVYLFKINRQLIP